MSEKPTKPNPGKLKLRKTVVKDMPLRTGKAGKVKGGNAAETRCATSCIPTRST
jgi:hypothetical protein